MEEEDVFERWLEEETEIHSFSTHFGTSTNDAFSAWTRYCAQIGHLDIGNSKTFKRWLVERKFIVKQTRPGAHKHKVNNYVHVKNGVMLIQGLVLKDREKTDFSV